MKRLLNYISSRRFAIFLLVITTSIILLSNLLPKPFLMNAQEVEKFKKERPLIYALSVKVGVERLTRSPYFRVIPVFIFLSVTLCTFRRLRAELERREGEGAMPEELPVRHSISIKPGGLREDEIALMLKKKGWRLLTKVYENQPHPHPFDAVRPEPVEGLNGFQDRLNPLHEGEEDGRRSLPEGEGSIVLPPLQGEGQGGDGVGKIFSGQRTVIYGTKGEKGIWGSLCFHVGMNVALIGILISITTGMDGKLALTEGFPVTTPDEIRGTKDVSAFPFREMMLDEFMPVFEGRFPVRYDSRLVGIGKDGRPRKYTIGVNSLLRLDDYKFIFTKAGFAPRFRLKRDGKEVIDTVVNLLITMPGVVDHFDIPKEEIRMKVEMFPDHYVENGIHKTKGKFPSNPVLFVKIEKGGKVIGQGFLSIGQAVNIEDYTLEFSELKHWVELAVSRDAGVPVIMAGFMMIAAGLCIRFILNDKRLWIIMNDNGLKLEIGGKTRFFPALFEEEMRGFAREIEKQVRIEV